MAAAMRADEVKPTESQLTLSARRAYWLETAVFFLVLSPWMGSAALGTPPEDLSFAPVAGAIILHDVALTALALYLVWRNGEGMAAIGWVRRGAGREIAVGVALFVPLFVGLAVLETLLRAAGLADPLAPPAYLQPQSAIDYLFALLLLLAVSVSEETVFRGYLLRRLTQVTGRAWLAVLLSSVVFALGHGYQGSLGVIAVGVIGVVFAVVYLKRGSLIAPMVMHFIQNFIGLIVAPQLMG